MAIYRVRKAPDGTFTVSAQMFSGGILRYNRFVKAVKPQDIGGVATTLAEEVGRVRVATKPAEDSGRIPGGIG